MKFALVVSVVLNLYFAVLPLVAPAPPTADARVKAAYADTQAAMKLLGECEARFVKKVSNQ